MKAANFKAFATSFALIAGMSFSSIVLADEVTLPVVTKPAVLEEGTQRVLSDEQVAEMLPWAKDSKVFLNDLLASIQGLSSQDKVEQLVQGISSIVGDSAPKNSELLMRYVLNRGLVVNEMLSREMGADEVGTVDAKIRVLTSSINMAISNYDNDLTRMSKKTSAPLAQFGNDYFKFLTELNKSIFDASAQFVIYRTALEWLQWDLYRDLNNRAFASQIVKINNSLKLYPAKKLTDAQAMSTIRQMKGVMVLVDVQSIITKMKQDEDAAIQKKMDEDAAILKKKIAEMLAKEKEIKERQDLINLKLKKEQDLINLEKRNANLVKKYGPVTETIQAFLKPLAGQIYFSAKSPAEGVCLALGYQMAGSVTTEYLSYEATLAIVDSDGNFIKAEITSGSRYSRDDKYITGIACANKFESKKNIELAQVTKFYDVSNTLFVSSKSRENGICKLLGYEKGLAGSAMAGSKMDQILPIINEDGNAINADSSSSRTILKQVVCMNKIAEATSLGLVNVAYPRIKEQYISKNSIGQGVCKNLGYKSGLEGFEYTMSYSGKFLAVVDVTGAVVNSEYVGDDIYVKGVICRK